MPVCILCEGVEFRPVYRDRRLEIVRCAQCGLIRQPAYAAALSRLDSAFDSVECYYARRGRPAERELSDGPDRHSFKDDIQHEIEKRVRYGARLLDVGCGRGDFLASLSQLGLDLRGVEPDPVLASWVQERHGIPVVCSMYKASLFSPCTFDVITFIQVFEHLEHPLDTLLVAHDHLKPGGLLVIDVPNFDNPRILAYRLTRCRRMVLRDFIPSHCYYYTRDTLSRLVKRAGFQVLRIETGRYAIKSGIHNAAMSCVDKLANALGIGGIVLYARS